MIQGTLLMIKKIFYTCLMLILCVNQLACAKKVGSDPGLPDNNKTSTFYVATSGSDSGKGDKDAPFRTIGIALAKANPGDTVFVRGGIYHEKILFSKSGRLDRYITLKAYPGEKPVIDGTGLPISGKEALVTIRKVNYIHFEGFDVCNYKSSVPGVDINGIVLDQGASNINIIKNKVYNIEHNVAPEDGRSGHGIEVLGNTDAPLRNILIEGNEIHDCNTGYSENLTINGYVDGFIIRGNKVYNGENIGIVAAGGYAANTNPAYNYARNGLITENEVFAIDGTTGPIPAYKDINGAIGIYVDGARRIIVERNKVYDSGRGIGIVSETDNFPTQDCIVRNNIVYDNDLTGIYLGGYIDYTGGGTRSCYVVNNTLYHNNRVKGYFGEVEGEIRLTQNCFDNVIKNNIIYARPNRIFVHKYNTSGSGNSIDNNLYYSEGPVQWIWEGVELSTFNDWKTALDGDALSTNGVDPLFVNKTTYNLHVEASSPAKNTGVIISTDINGAVDKDGNSRIVGDKIDKGAYQLQ